MKKKVTKKFVFNNFKKFWNYLWNDDSFLSYVLNFAFAFVFIKFLFFPTLGFVLNNDYPIVSIVSGSMEHKIVDFKVCDKVLQVKDKDLNFNQWWELCSDYYIRVFNLTYDNFSNFDYKDGLNIGDVMILYGKDPKKIEIGETLVFVPEDKKWFESHGPVIHRVVKKFNKDGKIYFVTKGDHNPYSVNNFETQIVEDDVIGVAKFRIRFIGYFTIYLHKIWQYFYGFVLNIIPF